VKTVKFDHPTSDARSITESDWKSLGIEDQGKVVWDKSNKFTAEVSDAAAEWLVQDDPEHMKILDSGSSGEDDSGEGKASEARKASGAAKKK